MDELDRYELIFARSQLIVLQLVLENLLRRVSATPAHAKAMKSAIEKERVRALNAGESDAYLDGIQRIDDWIAQLDVFQ